MVSTGDREVQLLGAADEEIQPLRTRVAFSLGSALCALIGLSSLTSLHATALIPAVASVASSRLLIFVAQSNLLVVCERKEKMSGAQPPQSSTSPLVVSREIAKPPTTSNPKHIQEIEKLPDEILKMSAEEIERRTRELNGEIVIMQMEASRVKAETENMEERMKVRNASFLSFFLLLTLFSILGQFRTHQGQQDLTVFGGDRSGIVGHESVVGRRRRSLGYRRG